MKGVSIGSHLPYIGSQTIDKVSSNPLRGLSIVAQTISLLIGTCQPNETWIDEGPISLPLYALGGEARKDMAYSLAMEEVHELEEQRKRITASWLVT